MAPVLFQAVSEPCSPAKMNSAGPVLPWVESTNRVVGLNTTPVGAPPPGMLTVSGTLAGGLPGVVAPEYSVEVSVPVLDTQRGLVGESARPQALTREGSVTGAWPAWSDTILTTWKRWEPAR